MIGGNTEHPETQHADLIHMLYDLAVSVGARIEFGVRVLDVIPDPPHSPTPFSNGVHLNGGPNGDHDDHYYDGHSPPSSPHSTNSSQHKASASSTWESDETSSSSVRIVLSGGRETHADLVIGADKGYQGSQAIVLSIE